MVFIGLKEDIYANIRNLLSAAIEKRLMANRRIGCLLSGGLDSSLISSLLVKLSTEKELPYKIQVGYILRLLQNIWFFRFRFLNYCSWFQSFSVGLGNDSPDLCAAREVAKHINSDHYEIICTEKDVINVLDDVIYSLESCDITTIRASICEYLDWKRIHIINQCFKSI